MPESFNDSATAFVAKSDLEADSEEVVREAADTRPLSLKNADNKIVTAAINYSISLTLQSEAHESQNGFVRKSQLVQNPVDIDSEARIAGNKVSSSTAQALSLTLGFSRENHENTYACKTQLRSKT